MLTTPAGQRVLIMIEDGTGNRITVWANEGSLSQIESVEGVVSVYTFGKTCYRVALDPRYERENIKRRIETAILSLL